MDVPAKTEEETDDRSIHHLEVSQAELGWGARALWEGSTQLWLMCKGMDVWFTQPKVLSLGHGPAEVGLQERAALPNKRKADQEECD